MQESTCQTINGFVSDGHLQRLLDAFAKLPEMTPEQVFEQRVSFVYGQLAFKNPSLTKDEVRASLKGLSST